MSSTRAADVSIQALSPALCADFTALSSAASLASTPCGVCAIAAVGNTNSVQYLMPHSFVGLQTDQCPIISRSPLGARKKVSMQTIENFDGWQPGGAPREVLTA